MMMKLEQLQTFLNQNEIPKIKGKPKTFLGIAKQPHYENVLSNIYAFYFKVNEVHKIKNLFVVSLLELINKTKLGKQKSGLENFHDFVPETEVPTNKGGRIDLLLSNGEQAIIIENKVYHHLNNDLVDYWDSIEILEENKIGVILSLQPVSDIKHAHFVNITHLQLLQTVMKNCGLYLLDANNKYIVFLKDLYQNIMNLSKPVMDKKELDFYYKNQTEINQLEDFNEQVYNHIVSEVEQAGLTLDGVNLDTPRSNNSNNKRLRYYVSPNHKNLMLTVVYENLLTKERKMHIAVEMEGKLLKDREIYRQIEFTPEEKEIAFSEHFTTTNEGWSHFAVKHYDYHEIDMTKLSEFIIKKLKDDKLLSIFRKLEDFLDSKK